MLINFNFIHTCVSILNTYDYWVLSDSHKYFHIYDHLYMLWLKDIFPGITFCMHVYTHTYIHTGLPISIHPCIYSYIQILVCMSTHMHKYIYRLMHVCLHTYMCHTGVFSGTIKSLVHALGTDSSMPQPTINSTLYTFIEQVNFYDLQKMLLQFPYVLYPLWAIPIWFTPCIIKTKHLISSFNMHFIINQLNQINSLASDNNR